MINKDKLKAIDNLLAENIIDSDDYENILQALGARDKDNIFDAILINVAAFFNLSPEQIKSKNRSSRILYARQITMYLYSRYTDASLQLIGQYMGGRDHSVVLHAINKITDLYKNDVCVMTVIDHIIDLLEKEGVIEAKCISDGVTDKLQDRQLPNLYCEIYDTDSYIYGALISINEDSYTVFWKNGCVGTVDFLEIENGNIKCTGRSFADVPLKNIMDQLAENPLLENKD